MNALRVFCTKENKWLVNHDGHEAPARFSSVDDMESFRSTGLHPSGPVVISVYPTGVIDTITLLDDTPLSEVLIPPNHSLYRDLLPS